MGPYHVHAVQRCIAVLGLLLTAANTPAFAQGEATIRGQVVAAANGSVLAAVPVTLAPVPAGESVQTTTDQEGRFSFRNARPGEYILSAAPDGFITRVSFWENVHTVFSAGMSPDVIDTANIMTGGFSAEYGNRFGGVVDVVTKSGLTMQNDGSVSVNGGQAGRRNVSGEFGGHRGRVGYYVFGSMSESDRFLSPPDPEAIHDGARGGHAFVQLDGK